MTGNGITLCEKCHTSVHSGFNGKPNLLLPMDSEGGEKIEVLTSLYKLLLDDARERDQHRDEYYYLSDQILREFKLLQDYDPFEYFPGLRLEQAYMIWNSCPMGLRNNLLEENGISSGSSPFLPGVTFIFDQIQ